MGFCRINIYAGLLCCPRKRPGIIEKSLKKPFLFAVSRLLHSLRESTGYKCIIVKTTQYYTISGSVQYTPTPRVWFIFINLYYLYHYILSVRLIRCRSKRFIINSKTINTKYLALIYPRWTRTAKWHCARCNTITNICALSNSIACVLFLRRHAIVKRADFQHFPEGKDSKNNIYLKYINSIFIKTSI